MAVLFLPLVYRSAAVPCSGPGSVDVGLLNMIAQSQGSPDPIDFCMSYEW